ncbi:hypothetical protein HUO13_17545 [Saccharopolyspora erythraea]|uniref:hypothetical protein n=1 Tax=Saccharopolyspora erythraea TaxID=1836 RepID=UPI001BAD41A7|nr:hypothetical protein [Saccharopolyspora erythraea]QUH02364.1 hypothetical protein HUO13_17545 [Saccharopolyspora erythraea]
MGNLDTGIISLLIASGTLLLSLLTLARIQRMRLEKEYRLRNEESTRIASETHQMRTELNALKEQIRELHKLLTETA